MQLASSDAAPHAILMVADKRLFTDMQHPVGADDSVRPQTSVLLCSSAERRCAERRDLSGGRGWRDGQLMAEIFLSQIQDNGTHRALFLFLEARNRSFLSEGERKEWFWKITAYY